MKKKIAILFTSLFASLSLSSTSFAIIAPPDVGPFPHCDYAFLDVDCYHDYFKAIDFLRAEGIVGGYSDGTFHPDSSINRAEMMKIIAEGAKKYFEWEDDTFDEYANESCFPDVPAEAWYSRYVCYGKKHGWVQGYADGTFRPSQNINFVEALKITMRGYAVVEYSKDTDPWYRGIVDRASELNYIPYTISGFTQELNRGEMADMITRIIKYNEDLLGEYLTSRVDLQVTYETIEAGQDVSYEPIRIQGK